MKKLDIYSLLLIFVTFGCKKDHSNFLPQSPGNTKYKLSFNLNGFTQQIIGSANKPGKAKVLSLVSDTASVRAMFDSIGYVLFNSAGQYVHSKTYDAKKYTFNTISDSVVAGKYTVAIYAGQSGVQLINQIHWLYYGLISEDPGTPAPWADTFAKTFPITVSNANVNQAVTLNRIVGEIEVIVKDVIPANAEVFNISLNNDYEAYDLYNAVPVNLEQSGNAITIPDTSKGKPNYKIDYITVNTITPFVFTLSCSTLSGNRIATRAFDTTSLQPNLKKIYIGEFFGTPLVPGSGFSANVNPAWSTVTTNISF